MKKVLIVGGGTVFHVRPHMALSAPAYGETARKLAKIAASKMPNMQIDLFLTTMAGGPKSLETSKNVADLIEIYKADLDTKVVFMNAAMVDFEGYIDKSDSGKDQPRLSTKSSYMMKLLPADKIIRNIREGRKDIFLVGFKTTAGADEQTQYLAGLRLCKEASCNLVLANDIITRRNMVITPEEAKYHVTTDRDEALNGLVEMTQLRSQLTFTRSTVVAGDPIPWDSAEVPEALRKVVDHCINGHAYKPFNGATVGHFAAKIGEKTFLTSRRKTDFNKLRELGLVKIVTDGPDSVIAYGSKPSVGGQSQRIVFEDHKKYDCIVHFHCPKKASSPVPTISQREYECGSHECGKNTSKGLMKFGNLSAVYLDRHGPNIVFHRSIDPEEVIEFINNNFDLTEKTGGSVKE
jgi:ribulose-5-phosphate 4-epimerase/fuculose-1-phosphate aldolase